MLQQVNKQQTQIKTNITRQFINAGKTRYSNLLILDGAGNLLFLKRSSVDDFEPSKWCVPGGKIETFETPKQAAIRETCEELNVGKIGWQQVDDTGKVYTNSTAIMYYYFTIMPPFIANSFTLDQNEHEQLVWLPPAEAITELDLLLDLGDHIKEIFNLQ